jgi:hypothetical protein
VIGRLGDRIFILALGIATGGCAARQPPIPAPVVPPLAAQNPSPMVERGRAHGRVAQDQQSGIRFTIDSILPKPVDVFIPDGAPLDSGATEDRSLLVHLFGAAYVPMHAVASAHARYVLAVVNLGAGSSANEKPLSDTAAWDALIRRIGEETSARTSGRVRITRIFVSAFSAGYGGVRALLSDDRIASTLDGVMLLDGLHTNYIPDREVVAEGGALDTTKLVPFLRYARRAVEGKARLLITHSEIFPGTFASTTETTDWLIAQLGLARTPVLAWGPGGMQQISEVRRGGLLILGVAGNTGQDHSDHLHGLGEFLDRLVP